MSVVLIDLAIFLCAALAVVAWLPKPQTEFPRMPAAPLSPPQPLDTRLTGAKRGLIREMLSLIGKPLPRWSARREEARGQFIDVSANFTLEEFLGVKVLTAFGFGLLALVIVREFGDVSPLWAGLGGLVGFVIPDFWLRARIARRHKAILRLLPEVIDILALCVGAGLDFLGALNRVVFLKGLKTEPLIEELAAVMQEIKLGKRRAEALKAMAKRVNLQALSSFVRTLVQADRMGTPIAEVLAIHSEDLRFERFTRAERLALKAPIKILIPLIFCILPSVALIVGAPIFIQFLTQSPFGR